MASDPIVPSSALEDRTPGPWVLVVDDDPSILRRMRALLGECGYLAECVSSLEEFRAAFARRPYALVVLDVIVGPEDAGGFLGYLSSMNCCVPIVLVSGYSQSLVDSILPAASGGSLDIALRLQKSTFVEKLGNYLRHPLAAARAGAGARPMRLLVVDSDRAVRRRVCQVAESCGFEAEGAGTVLEFRGRFAQFSPSMIVSDVILGQEDVTEVLGYLARRSSLVPVILMSGFSNHLSRSIADGAAGRNCQIVGQVRKGEWRVLAELLGRYGQPSVNLAAHNVRRLTA